MVESAGPESAVARFRDRTGAVVGAGFLVGDRLVVTCAHVVAAALGRDEGERPGEPVTLEFPVRGRSGPARCTATVLGWTPTRPDERGDIAVLRLDGEVPDGVRPAWLSPAPAPADSEIDALGFPEGLAAPGLWARGRIRRVQAAGWLQVAAVPGERAIEPGFSGTPAFSARDGGVVGMVVAVAHGSEHTAFLTPARTLVAEHPVLAEAQASPYRGLAAFAERDAAYFRGRAGLIKNALARAAVQPLLVLSGPSGSGKSSLARAGLLPRLRAQGRAVATVRVVPDEPAEPLLARIVAALTSPPVDSPPGDSSAGGESPGSESTGGELSGGESRSPGAGGAAGVAVGRDIGRVVEELRVGAVLVDQFEEADPGTARVVAGYLHRLAEAAGPRPDGAPRLLVVITLRGRQLDAVATGETAAAMLAGLVLVAPMTAAELREAVAPPGAAFEPGLAERLVVDAGADPGTLPLLEFTLDRLWERRELGILTHAGYDELGGVAGAMTRYADRAYERDPARARRLLVLLARPDDDGVFRRRPLPLADLPAGLRPALDRLVASRLVVVGTGVAGAPTVELAHEALIRDWPRLRGWLEDDREFRTWQERTRGLARQWQAGGADPAALLRGAALAAAVGWAEARGADLGRDEAEYLRASVAQERRGARRARTVTAALAVLTLLAGAFALVAQQQTGELREQLRTAASRQLADDAQRFRRSRPGMSLQLALAAWHARQTPEAYGALLTQYAALEPVDRLFRDLTVTASPITSVSTSRDGSVAAVVDERGGGAVWRGLAGGEPHRVVFAQGPPKYVGGHFRVSPSGRYLAYANDLGGVYVRDIAHPDQPPVDLAPSGPDRADGVTVVQSVRFAPDDSRLLVLRTDFTQTVAELRVWDLRTRRPVPNLPRLDGRFAATDAFFGPAPGSLVLSAFGVVASYDLAGRRPPRTFGEVDRGQPMVAGGGSLVVSCGRGDTVVVRDVGTGRRVRSIAVASCSGFVTDANGEVAVLASALGEANTNVSLTVIDPRTGRVHQVAVPPVDMRLGFEPISTLSVHRGGDGVPVLLLSDGGQLYRIRVGPAVTPSRDPTKIRMGVATPDGAYRVLLHSSSGRATVVRTRTNQEVASVAAKPLLLSSSFRGLRYGITGDSGHLFIAGDEELVVYALPGLTVERRLRLPVPPDLGGPPPTDGFVDWAGSVVPVGVSEAVVLYAGLLTRWNVATGARVGEPVELRGGKEQGSRRRAALLAYASHSRPAHPDQVTVVLPDSTVQLWSLDQRRSLARFDLDAALTAAAAVFHPDGTLLAVKDRDGFVSVWPVDNPRRQPWRIPTGVGSDPLGFTPGADSNLITREDGSETGVTLWDLAAAKRVARITAPVGSQFVLRGAELGIFHDAYARWLRLDPGLWFSRLCAMAARPYTAEETRLLGERRAPVNQPCP